MAESTSSAPVFGKEAVVKRAGAQGITLDTASVQERATLFDIAKRAFPDDKQWYNVSANTDHYLQRERDFTRRGLVCVVARKQGSIVGYIFYQPDRRKRSEMYVKEIGVHPDHQGGGVGTFLLAYVAGEAKDKGRAMIKLYITEREGYYLKLGFTKVPQKQYDDEGYTTDGEKPDMGSTLMSGVVDVVSEVLAKKIRLS